MQKRYSTIIGGAIFILGLTLSANLLATDAKKQFETGLALFQKGEFVEAAIKFRKANEMRPNWRIFYNLGQSEAAAKQYGLAISSFEKYLSQGGDEISNARQAYVIKELKRMREMVGFLEIDAPDGIEIYIDGVHRGATPFAMNIPVAASVEHELGAYMEGNQVNSKIVMVMGQQTTRVTVEIENVQLVSSSGIDWGKDSDDSDDSEQDGADGSVVDVSAKKSGGNPAVVKNVAIVVGAVGVASIVGGTVSGIVALKKKGDVEDACPSGCYEDDYGLLKSRDNAAMATNVLMGVGAGFVVTGAVLFFVSKKMKKKEVAIIPGGTTTSFVPTLQVRF